MKLFYLEICKRINSFAIGTHTEYFTSESGVKTYEEFFEKYLYAPGEMWINKRGRAYVNNADHIVAEE